MKKILVVMTVCSVAACGSEKQAESKLSSPSKLIETQLDALEKAKEVEATLQDAVDQREKMMREQGI